MNPQALKYPNRADTLALLKSRERGHVMGTASPRTSSTAGADRPEAPVCFTALPASTR